MAGGAEAGFLKAGGTHHAAVWIGGVALAYDTCATIKAGGGLVVRDAGPMKHGTTVIAFVEDPDGYKIELIQRNSRKG